MVTVVCDTCVVNVNAAVDYGNVFVFVNTHGYCVVNNSCYFYAYAVIARGRHLDGCCRAFFCGSCFYLDADNCQFIHFTRNVAVDSDDDFIIVIAYNRVDFCAVCFNGDFVACAVGKFKTAVQFQFDCVAFINHCCHVRTYGRFDFQIFNGYNFFHCNVFQFLYGSIDALGFDGCVYQIIAVCDNDITGIYCYSCLCVFGCFCQLGSQVVGQYISTFHLTNQCECQVVCVADIQICDIDICSSSVSQFVATFCLKISDTVCVIPYQ